MKNIILALCLLLTVAACSSGTTVSDLPQNATSTYAGSFQSSDGNQSGTVTLNIVEDNTGNVTGNIIFNPNGPSCLSNASVTGTSNGFNISLTAEQGVQIFSIQTIEREAPTTTTDPTTGVVTETEGAITSDTTVTSTTGQVGTVTTTNADGTVTIQTTTVSDETGTLSLQLALNGDSLAGTYVVSGATCAGQSNSGTVNLTG